MMTTVGKALFAAAIAVAASAGCDSVAKGWTVADFQRDWKLVFPFESTAATGK